MLHYEQVFSNVFERRQSKCCAVLMIFVVSVKIHFCQRQTKCIDDQDKFQSVKDTDNEFTECETPRKKLQSIGILHAFTKTLKSNISEV